MSKHGNGLALILLHSMNVKKNSFLICISMTKSHHYTHSVGICVEFQRATRFNDVMYVHVIDWLLFLLDSMNVKTNSFLICISMSKSYYYTHMRWDRCRISKSNKI